MPRKLRMGMVGGGEGAFIGAIHRMAAALDGQIELVCGAFSSSVEKSLASGRALYLPDERCYPDFETLFKAEQALPEGERMDFVSVVTPNHLHFPVCKSALEHGFHVVCDKPATLNLDEALQLRDIVQASGLCYGLTHTYTGYPLVKEARARVQDGELGAVRKVLVEYPQGWLAQAEEHSGNKQAEWRLDPARAGVSSCMGDIGVHAAHLAEYVTGLKIESICADLNATVDGRSMDDDGTVLLRFENGASGVLVASQICAGEENPLRIRVYGERGGLEWAQQEPNSLLLKFPDAPQQLLRTGMACLGDLAAANTRTPGGHPEGYIEAFANHYRNFAGQVRAAMAGREATAVEADVPGIADAVRGMAFIEQVVAAAQETTKWHPLPQYQE